MLLSGGLDSAVCLAMAKERELEVYALTINYGQRHANELKAASRIAEALAADSLQQIDVDLTRFGGSSLTADIPVPKNRDLEGGQIPTTYVPARNTIFLSLALAYAEVVGAREIHIGVNARDYSGYPDCRPEFVEAFQALANVATKSSAETECKVRIVAPLIHLSKRQIVEEAVRLRVPTELTISCYDPTEDSRACGECDACRIRAEAFQQARVADKANWT